MSYLKQFAVIFMFSFFSACKDIPVQTIMNDKTILPSLLINLRESSLLYHEEVFYVTSQLKSSLYALKKDSVINQIALTRLYTSEKNSWIAGNVPQEILIYNDELIVVQSHPNKLFKFELGKFQKTSSINIPLSLNESIANVAVLPSGDLVLSTDVLNQPTLCKLYIFNLSQAYLKHIYDGKVEKDAAFSIVRVNGEEIHLLHPYDQKLIKITSEGKVISETTFFSKEVDFQINKRKYSDNPENPYGLSIKEKLALLNDQVLDFYLMDNFDLFLIHKSYNRADTLKIDLSIGLSKINLKNSKSQRILSEKIPLRFEQKGNIFQTFEGENGNILAINPLDITSSH